MPADDAESVVETEADARIIGTVEETDGDEGAVAIRGLEL
jgi:hypothetical protein